MFYVLILAICVFLVRVTLAQGVRAAVSVGWIMALIVPYWLFRNYGPIRLDMQTSICIALFACVALHPTTRLPRRFVLADILMGGLALVVLVSEVSAAGLKISLLVRPVQEWLMPYVLGRLLFQSYEDIRRITPLVAYACLLLAVWAGFEAVAKVNPISYVTNHSSPFEQPHTLRLGFKRAEGPFTHPIYFGMVLLLLAPWTLEAARRAYQGDGPKWWLLVPCANAAAILCTMSRGPALGLIFAAYVTVFLSWPKWRVQLFAVGLLACIAVLAGRHLAYEVLTTWSGEKDYEVFFIDGEPYPYTGTDHRWLQFLVYERAIAEAGLLGFGKLGPIDGSPHMEYVEDHLEPRFASIDNHYIYMILSSGYLGVLLFLLLGACTIYYLAKQAGRVTAPYSLFAASTCGVLVAQMCLMLTVWLARDFGFMFLSTFGLAASWRAHAHVLALEERPSWNAGSMARQPGRGVSRRLVPGHPS